MPKRCSWAESHPLLVAYHDTEWGVPVLEEHKLFEFMVLDGMQAGLSWLTILKKREAFRAAFAGFDPERVARFRKPQVERLMKDAAIVRNRQKIEATIENARAFLRVRSEHGSFSTFIWDLAGPLRKTPIRRNLKAIPARTAQSEKMSRRLMEHGFRFVGPTICYAFMQAAGMVNDHLVDCYRHREVERLRTALLRRPSPRAVESG